MTDRRRTFNTTEREAILHLRVLELEGRAVPLDVQKTLSAKQINAWFDADHFPIRYIDGGTTAPWNGQMLINRKGAAFLKQINEHGIKTATKDIPEIAKADRVTEANEEFRRKMLSKVGLADPEPKASKPKRRWKPEGATYNWRTKRYERETAE